MKKNYQIIEKAELAVKIRKAVHRKPNEYYYYKNHLELGPRYIYPYIRIVQIRLYNLNYVQE